MAAAIANAVYHATGRPSARCRSRSGNSCERATGQGSCVNFSAERTPSATGVSRQEAVPLHRRKLTQGAEHGKAPTWQQRIGGLGARVRLHGDELRLRSSAGSAGDDRPNQVGRRARRNVLRHRPGLRSVHERRVRRTGSRADPRARGDRDEVRDHSRARRPGGHRQPTRGPQAERRRLAQAARCRNDRPFLPTPCRPGRAHRRRRRRGRGTHRARQGEALRHVRGRRANDPPRPRGAAGLRGAERVLAVVATACRAAAANARGARHRVRPVQPARQGLTHREDR